MIPKFELMLARSVDEFPQGADLVWEPKWDGFRAASVITEHGAVQLVSRRGAILDTYPEINLALHDAGIPYESVLDGEVVRWSQAGRLDFDAVSRRFRAGRRRAHELANIEPVHYVIWDVLVLGGRDVRRLPLRRRRELLEELLAQVPSASPLALTWQTNDPAVARDWMRTLPEAGIEGVVAKRVGDPYTGGRGWLKYKARHTVDGIVGAVTGTSLRRPDRLVIGRYDSGGTLRITATTTPLRRDVSEHLGALLTPAGEGHPWPSRIAVAWGHRATAILRVEPLLVVEVEVDTAMAGHRHRHLARAVRLRPDLAAADVSELADAD